MNNDRKLGQLVKCEKCGRKILVERALLGVNHTLDIKATCWECLTSKAKGKASRACQLPLPEGRGL